MLGVQDKIAPCAFACLATRRKNDDCSVGTFVKLMWVHPCGLSKRDIQQEEKKRAAWGKARCSWFWHLSAESPGKWFQWCQFDGMFNFACVAGLRIRIWAFTNHTICWPSKVLLGFSGGGGQVGPKNAQLLATFWPKSCLNRFRTSGSHRMKVNVHKKELLGKGRKIAIQKIGITINQWLLCLAIWIFFGQEICIPQQEAS